VAVVVPAEAYNVPHVRKRDRIGAGYEMLGLKEELAGFGVATARASLGVETLDATLVPPDCPTV
jgi:hypothetical protein